MLQHPPELQGLPRARWRLADLKLVVPALETYSLAGLSKLLRRLGVRRQRGRLCIHSPDLAYSAKVALLAHARQLAEADPAGVHLLYADEVSFYRQPTLAPVYGTVGTEPTAHLAPRSNTRYRIGGAVDSHTGQVCWIGRSKLGTEGLGQFLRAVRSVYPTGRVLLVWDNWPVHQNPRVLTVASELGIELLWLPTYAPWTNPIEKLWRWLRQEVLHAHRLADHWEELKARVAAFLDQFHDRSPALLRYTGLLPD